MRGTCARRIAQSTLPATNSGGRSCSNPPTAAFLDAAGASTQWLHLGDHGVHGNGHGLIDEKNSDAALAPVLDWLARHVACRAGIDIEIKENAMDIGIIGLGAMGRAMARNLVAAGHAVTIWNRSGGTVEGARTVATPREALQGDAALTMLADDAAIRAVLLEPGALAQANPGLVHVVASTISVALARELARRHAELGLAYVAAPVLGRPDVAASAQLNILAAGDPAAVRRVEPLFAAIGRQVWDMGTDPAGANAAKIACNMMITMAIEAMAEAVVLSEGHGVGRDRLFDVMLNTLFGCRAYQTYSANIAHDAYEPGFKATLGLKDLAAEAAGEVGGSLPMLEAVHRRMAETVAAGRGAQDWSAMADFTIATATRGR